MATLTRSAQTCGSYVRLEPEISWTSTPASSEWSILQALRSHHQRLERKTRYTPLRRSVQDIGSIKRQNDLALCDTHLRQILTRGDLDTIVEHRLKEQEEAAQSHLMSICSLLNGFASSIVLLEVFKAEDLNDQTFPYSRLSKLTEILNTTAWSFDLTMGQGHVLFTLESEQDAYEAKNVFSAFDQFFSHSMILPVKVQNSRQPSSQVRDSRYGLRDQAVKGIESLLRHVPQDLSAICQGHRMLIKLPDWDNIEKQAESSRTDLELFLSTCTSPERWHQGCCAVRSPEASDDEDICDFCEELRHATSSGVVLRFIAKDKSLFMSSEENQERIAKPDSQPTRSLCDLIENQSFCESWNITPLMDVKRTQRFNKTQRRALASRLALTLSLFLNSDYALNASEATSIFFVVEDGRCELDLVYATSAANGHDEDITFNDSMSMYNDLARTLLEIEYGVSLKTKQLGELKTWVDDILEEANRDSININNMEASTSYLTAVRDLLNFKRTYRKGSRRFKGRLFDIGAIAGEIIYSDVAKRLRSCIEPIQLNIPGLESSKEEFRFQQLELDNAGEKGGRRIVKRSATRTTALTHRTAPVQLFDDKEDFEEDRGLATKADFFFNQLDEFLSSCEERATSLDCFPRRAVRIAVLDTGINQTSGAIKGGLRKKRIQRNHCHSWVGNDPDSVHDVDGHGSRIAELILRAAPEADLYICKVFNGRTLQSDEVQRIAKAITYAVDIWDVDIISMSFGLTSDNLINDQQLETAFRDIETAIENAKSKIFFAAAANHGSHGPRTFPANHDAVICIHASNGKGKDGGISPKPERTDDNFMTLGMALDFGGNRKSGTSYAAPMAASMAAHILHTAENLLDLPETAIDRMRTGRGMREMFRMMCIPSDSVGYQFVAPWVTLWKTNWHLDDDKIKFIESTIRTRDIFRY